MADKAPKSERVTSASEASPKQEAIELAVTDMNGTEHNNEDDKPSLDLADSDHPENQVEERKEQPLSPQIDTVISDVKQQLEQIDDTYRDQKYSRGECLCYFTFLIVFTTMAVLARGVSDVSFTQTIAIRQSLIDRDEFTPWNDVGEKSFDDASTIDDIYQYIQQIALPFLLRPQDNYYVQSQQALLGGIRLKQLRMTQTECERANFTGCYGDEFFKGTQDFYYPDGSKAISYTYIDSSVIKDQSWRGKYGTYPGGGFIIELGLDLEEAIANVSFLQNISWLDGGTRFLAMDFNTYNPSTSLHTISRIAWEMPTGGVFPNDEVKTWKFERYAGNDGTTLAVFHVLFILWVTGMTIMTFMECYKKGCLRCGKDENGRRSFWNSKWKAIDCFNLFVFYISIVLYIVNESYRRSQIDMYDTETFQSFRQLQYGFTMESYTTAVNGALLWIKLFKYLAFNKRLRFLFTMLSRSKTDILMFGIVLGVFVIAFGTAGFLTFNSDVDDFRSYVFSMGNMVRFTLVDMPYNNLSLSARLWGSFFYYCWSLLMLLILANVFIAILTEAYSQVQMELTEEDKIDLNFLGMGGAITRLRATIADRINKAVKHDEFDDDGDGKVSAQELAHQTNITVEKAKEIIAEHDVDGDGQLDVTEFQRLKEKIISEQMEAQAIQQQVSSPGFRGSPRAMAVSGVNSEEFEVLKGEVKDIMELLTAVLDQTPAGKRALKQREAEKNKETKKKKRKSTVKKE